MRRLGLVVLLVSFGCAEDGSGLSDGNGTGPLDIGGGYIFPPTAVRGEFLTPQGIHSLVGWRGEVQFSLPVHESGQPATFSVSHASMQVGDEIQFLDIIFSPPTIGAHEGVLFVTCENEECQYEIPLEGTGVPLIVESSVEFLDFGTVQNACSRELSAEFTNQSEVIVAFEVANSTERFRTSEIPALVGPGQSVTVVVSFDGPIEDGDFSDVLVARITADGQSEEVPVNLVGRTNPRGDTCN